MTKLLIHYDVYVPMSCLSSWLQSLPTTRVKQAMKCSSYLNKLLVENKYHFQFVTVQDYDAISSNFS